MSHSHFDAIPLVVKIGGQGLSDFQRLQPLLNNIINTVQQRPVVVVHGGGQLVDTWMQHFAKPVIKTAGLRVTSNDDMPIIAGALAGALNTQLVAQLNQLSDTSLRAVGCSLADAQWCHLEQDYARGAVGVPCPQQSNARFLTTLLQAGFTPVLSSIGMFADGSLANVNADLAAATVAAILQADLLLLTDVDAILDHQGQVITQLDVQRAQQLIDAGTVKGGMRVKLSAAIEAAQLSRRSTAVAAWYSPADLTAHFTGQVTATQIVV